MAVCRISISLSVIWWGCVGKKGIGDTLGKGTQDKKQKNRRDPGPGICMSTIWGGVLLCSVTLFLVQCESQILLRLAAVGLRRILLPAEW